MPGGIFTPHYQRTSEKWDKCRRLTHVQNYTNVDTSSRVHLEVERKIHRTID